VKCPKCHGSGGWSKTDWDLAGPYKYYEECEECKGAGQVKPRPHVVKGRALTPEQKREVVERIYAAWCKPLVDQQRLGQLIRNSVTCGNQAVSYYIEDFDLVEAVERFADR
jgi:hypothetical protein